MRKIDAIVYHRDVSRESPPMRRFLTLLTISTVTLLPLSAKEKQPKSPMPFTVLKAKTIAVVIDPDAGRSVRNPQGNETAQRDVETALGNWGRFQTTMSYLNADLIIVIRKGTGRMVDETIPDPRQNGRVGTTEPLDNGVYVGAQHGAQPNPTSRPSKTEPRPTTPVQTEVTTPDDTFFVYMGGSDTPLDDTPVWKYIAKDGLKSPSVPAVVAFRKAFAETEQAASKNP
jgi:hypothetical protein